MAFRSGFVAIVGRPNVGKSTLLNQILGEKVAIVSDRPQTTRNRIRGVKHLPDAQIIFVDTPGVHRPHHKMNEWMVREALASIQEVDLILFMVEVHGPFGPGDRYALEQMQEARGRRKGKALECPVFLVINKIDLVQKAEILPIIDEGRQLFPFEEIIPVSASTGENVDRLLACIVQVLPEGPPYFPEDVVTDQPLRFIAAELIREKVFHLTYQEIPYSVGIAIEEFREEPGPKGIIYVRAVIYVERDSQKGILIGRGGSMLKRIGQQARLELEAITGARVYLELWVKVKKDWRDDDQMLRVLGYR